MADMLAEMKSILDQCETGRAHYMLEDGAMRDAGYLSWDASGSHRMEFVGAVNKWGIYKAVVDGEPIYTKVSMDRWPHELIVSFTIDISCVVVHFGGLSKSQVDNLLIDLTTLRPEYGEIVFTFDGVDYPCSSRYDCYVDVKLNEIMQW